MTKRQLPTILFLLLNLLLIPFLIGCQAVRGSGTATSETRDVSGVNQVQINVTGTLLLTIGETESLTIDGDDNIVPNIRTVVRGNKLTIDYAETNVRVEPQTDLVYTLTLPDLTEFVHNSSGTANLAGLQSDISIKVNGSSDVIAIGSLDRLDVDINGSGAFDGAELITAETGVSINGSGSARVHTTKSLDARINGSGDVRYSGDGTVREDISGSGSVEAAAGR